MKARRIAGIVFAAVAGCVSVASADVVYSTFGAGQSFDTGNSYNIVGPDGLPASLGSHTLDIAASFNVTTAFTFDSVTLAQRNFGTRDTVDVVDVQIVADDGGKPGSTVIEDIGAEQIVNGDFQDISSVHDDVYTYSSSTHPLLAAGNYWVVVSPFDYVKYPAARGTFVGWAFNNTTPLALGLAYDLDSMGWSVHTDASDSLATAPAFEVDATPVAVPLPSAAGAGAVLLAATFALKRGRKSILVL